MNSEGNVDVDGIDDGVAGSVEDYGVAVDEAALAVWRRWRKLRDQLGREGSITFLPAWR